MFNFREAIDACFVVYEAKLIGKVRKQLSHYNIHAADKAGYGNGKKSSAIGSDTLEVLNEILGIEYVDLVLRSACGKLQLLV